MRVGSGRVDCQAQNVAWSGDVEEGARQAGAPGWRLEFSSGLSEASRLDSADPFCVDSKPVSPLAARCTPKLAGFGCGQSRLWFCQVLLPEKTEQTFFVLDKLPLRGDLSSAASK